MKKSRLTQTNKTEFIASRPTIQELLKENLFFLIYNYSKRKLPKGKTQ